MIYPRNSTFPEFSVPEALRSFLIVCFVTHCCCFFVLFFETVKCFESILFLGNGALKKCFVTINIIKFRKLYVSGVVFCFCFVLYFSSPCASSECMCVCVWGGGGGKEAGRDGRGV